MGNGIENDLRTRKTDLYQLQQIVENDDYTNDGHESTDRLMEINTSKTRSVSFLRNRHKSDLSSEEGSESGSDTKCKKKRKGAINLTGQLQKLSG